MSFILEDDETILDSEGFIAIEFGSDFWLKFIRETEREDWSETINRMNKEGWNINGVFRTEYDFSYNFPHGFVFNTAAEKLKFIMKYS